VPLQRPAAPDRDQAPAVERVDYQDEHRHVDEQQAQPKHDAGESGTFHALPSISRAWLRLKRMIGMIRINSITTASAEAPGQLRRLKNSSQSTLPIISVCEPPSSSGITNSPITGMNTSMQPAMMPFFDSGTVTFQKLAKERAPRSEAASSRLRSCFTRLA